MDDRTARDVAASPHTYTDTQQRIALSHLARALSERDAELAHARPMTDAAHAWCVARRANDPVGVSRAITAVLAAHDAATPSTTPSSHVIVERAEVERLRAVDEAAADYVTALAAHSRDNDRADLAFDVLLARSGRA